MCSQVQYTIWVKGVMSSYDITKEMMDEVTKGQVVQGTEGDQHDVSMLHTSDNEESEQDRMVDEALQDESGEGTESTKVVEGMEVSDDTPKAGTDNVKPTEQMDEARNTNQEVGITHYKEDKDMTLEESIEDKDGKEKL